MNVRADTVLRSIPTYPVGRPEKNPVFFDRRVYQGSSGKIYPVPFIDKVHDEPVDVPYRIVILENEHLYLELLPEIGGRIFRAQDKNNGNEDFFYRQEVIKPALVGVAGPWISGGVEFNWPQHHRPSTYLPCDFFIEKEADGACTVWMSEIDPLQRMKGMHGIRLRPGSAVVELRARLYNRTPLTRSFLWWANVAARVHDRYQAFFPTDVHYVADHAVRAMSSFPKAENLYYGVDYAKRPGRNDLSWYSNIPVPTSYMVCETAYDFFGGFDHGSGGGFIHVADRHIAPGKKLWTWGNHDFGWTWDRELTDEGGPYIELMAGVYTDNQPDFSYLIPGEEKHFSQFWWPYQQLGPVQNASEDAALRLMLNEDGSLEIGAAASRTLEGCRLELRAGDESLLEQKLELAPGKPWRQILTDLRSPAERLQLTLHDAAGRRLLEYRPEPEQTRQRNRVVATEPPSPDAIPSQDELRLTGEHLELYRHPTRQPEPYWEKALERDSGDHQANLALGRRRLQQGRFEEAEGCLRRSIERLTFRHPNPETGEAHYYLGLTLRYRGRLQAAADALHKATWNYAWRSPAHYELAAHYAVEGDWRKAREHAGESLETNIRHNKAIVLLAAIDRREGNTEAARDRLDRLQRRDPLDPWARHERALLDDDWAGFADSFRNDAQTILDVALDYAHVGLYEESRDLLNRHHELDPVAVAVPTLLSRSLSTRYLLAQVLAKLGEATAASSLLAETAKADPAYFFPSRIDEQRLLEWALEQQPSDPNAAFGLGNYLYDRSRRAEAIACWENAVKAAPEHATAWRNLGIALWNDRREGDAALEAYRRAVSADPTDARLVFECDQLKKKLGMDPAERLRYLLDHRERVQQRDDASLELATLHNETGDPQAALDCLLSRRFHPWEGGEGKVLGQYKAARLALGQRALEAGDPQTALQHFEQSLEAPASFGETFHLLQSKADVNYWRGKALHALGQAEAARKAFEASAHEAGDFDGAAVVAWSELSYYSGLSLSELGRSDEARSLFEQILAHISETSRSEPKIDYFATSLPNLLVFEEDLRSTRDAALRKLEKLAQDGLQQIQATQGRA